MVIDQKLLTLFAVLVKICFEASKLGCEVFASDLNPIACMLTWGAFHIIGGTEERLKEFELEQKLLSEKVKSEIDSLAVERDGKGWQAKTFLYCVEVRCPQTGWMVPLLTTRVVSMGYRAIAVLIPDEVNKRYNIEIHSGVTKEELADASTETVCNDGDQEPFMVHKINGFVYRTKISTLRGDYKKEDGSTGNKLRLWSKKRFQASSRRHITRKTLLHTVDAPS